MKRIQSMGAPAAGRTALSRCALALCAAALFGCSAASESSGADHSTDGTTATDSTDGTTGSTSSDGTDSTDATDSTDGTSATDGTDATDSTDGTDAQDATDASDATDGTDGTVPGWKVEATEADVWVYLDLESQAVVEPTDPENDEIWDLAISRTLMRTNSGTTGAGLAGARLSDQTFEALTETDTVGFAVDAMLPVPGPPGSGEFTGNPALLEWYDYDPTTHQVSANDKVWVIRTADGDYVKLQVLFYDDGVFGLNVAEVTRAPAVHSTTFDGADFQALDFASGTVVLDDTWDLAVFETQLRTNGGTSGTGNGAAMVVETETFGDVTGVPRAGCYLAAEGHVCKCEMSEQECTDYPGVWTDQCGCEPEASVDETLPVPGPPGSGEYSGNPVLAGWYDYDPQTHVVSPKPVVFLVRGDDGVWARIQITDYADGAMSIDWTWAGPGWLDF